MKELRIEGEVFEVYDDVYDLVVGQSKVQEKLADLCVDMLSFIETRDITTYDREHVLPKWKAVMYDLGVDSRRKLDD